MKAFAIAVKNIKYVLRNFKQNGIVFILPFVFMALFGFVFGKSNNDITFDVGILKQESPLYAPFLENLKKLENPEKKPLFTIKEYTSEEEAIKLLEKNELPALIKLDQTQSVIVKGNATNQEFNTISGILQRYTNQFFKVEDKSPFKTEFINTTTNDFSSFDFIAPGLIVYGILMLIPQTAASLTAIAERKELFRYFTSKASALDIIGGYVLSQTVFALIQSVILFFTAQMFGFESKASFWTALVIIIPTNIFAVGTGLCIGAITKKMDSAANIGSLLSIILGFLSGSFIAGPGGASFLKTLLGFDIIPSAYASRALVSTLLYGRGLGDVVTEIIVITASGVGILLLGAFLYNYKQLRTIE